MKTTLVGLVLVLTTLGCSRAQNQFPTRQWSVTLRIVDETGQPVTNAQAAVTYLLPTPIGEELRSGKVSGLTDTNGVFTATHVDCTSSLGFRIQKEGYYSTFVGYELGYPPKIETTNLPTQTLTLKRIGKPIPMYAKRIDGGIPVLGEPVGYDLSVGDWVVPHGNGRITDIFFTKVYTNKSSSEYYSRLTVSFPNLGDGIQEFSAPDPAMKGSSLRSPHKAPETGYERELIRQISAGGDWPRKFDYDENRIYFFRVRTVLDDEGNVKSALYGKIYGDFMQFRYFLNPTSNDRNVEFDPKRNLFPENMRGGVAMDMP